MLTIKVPTNQRPRGPLGSHLTDRIPISHETLSLSSWFVAILGNARLWHEGQTDASADEPAEASCRTA